MKRLALMTLAGMMLLNVAGCSSTSTSSTTVTSSVTDENGNTTTTTKTTTTDENGNTTTDTTVTTDSLDSEGESGENEAERRKLWESSFSGGAIGTNESGDTCYLALDNIEDATFAAMILEPSDTSDLLFMIGDISADENDLNHLEDMDTDTYIDFTFVDPDNSDADFAIKFQDGDVFQMKLVDQKTIVDSMMPLV